MIETRDNLESIGGLDVLKGWLLKRKLAFGAKAMEYGLPTLKGLMIVGVSGYGKSLTAKATAKVFGVPLLKLDAARIYGGLVGQSEANLRNVIQTAEAIAPCCLWLDEAEKALSGSKSSGSTDGGTSARVFGTFLNWLQEKSAPVFVVATANDVSQFPPELLRNRHPPWHPPNGVYRFDVQPLSPGASVAICNGLQLSQPGDGSRVAF